MTTTNIITARVSAYAPLRVRSGMRDAKFATLRIQKDGTIRDGRIYKSENGMRANRESRPKEARMFVVKPLGQGYYELAEII